MSERAARVLLFESFAIELLALAGESTPKASVTRTLLVEWLTSVSTSTGGDPPALSPRLGEIARREHMRRSIAITIQSFGITPCRCARPRARASIVHRDP